MTFFKEIAKGFKQFILRGSVIDLAVGVMIGAAFNGVVTALVKDLMTPFIAAIVAKPDFSKLSFTIHGSQFLYGDFINNLISFLILAITIYFFIVVPINKLTGKPLSKEPPPVVPTKECPECLSPIPAKARRCAYCTTILSEPAQTAQKR
jgi:large conductance mechanosensitive channel